MRQRVFVLWTKLGGYTGGCHCGGEYCDDDSVQTGWWEYPSVDLAEQRADMERRVGLTCVVALGPDVIDDVRPNGGASAIASDLARRAGRSLGRGRKRK